MKPSIKNLNSSKSAFMYNKKRTFMHNFLKVLTHNAWRKIIFQAKNIGDVIHMWEAKHFHYFPGDWESYLWLHQFCPYSWTRTWFWLRFGCFCQELLHLYLDQQFKVHYFVGFVLRADLSQNSERCLSTLPQSK